MSTVAVIGAGAWGTALAQMLATDGREVLLWAREPELAEEINARHTNSLFLPSAALAPTIRATSELADTAGHDILLLVTPAQHLATTMTQLPAFPRDLVLCAKGIEVEEQVSTRSPSPHSPASVSRCAPSAAPNRCISA